MLMRFGCPSSDHGYEPIVGVTSEGEPSWAAAHPHRRSGRLLRRCGAVFCAVGLWVAVKSYNPLVGAGLSPREENAVSLSSSGGEGKKELRKADSLLLSAGSGGATSGTDLLMQVLVTNKYQRDEVNAMQMYPWEHIAEPARETRMEILSWPGGEESAKLEFMWHVDGTLVGTGAKIKTVFSSPGRYECSVSSRSREIATDAGVEDDKERQNAPPDIDVDVGVGGAGRPGEPDPGGAGRPLASLGSSIRAARGGAAGAAPSAGAAAGGGATAPDPVTTLDFVVVVKYVRREIRTLTDRDREVFFNAVAVMQRVPSAVGQAVYGSKYYSKDYFNRMHLYYGGRRDCDHWHGGAGFVTSHIAFSLMYEQSLQAINPSIALPYWDFTIEGTFFDWSNFRTSSVFSDDWFGAGAPQNPMRTPMRGRFAYVSAMMDATEYSEVHNSYGMLRSPWNNDPTPFLTRSDHLMGYRNHRKPSGCRRYRDAMMQKNWMSLTVAFNEGAHGEIHELLGGTWSLQVTAYADKTKAIVQPFVHMAVPYLKKLWRTGYIECPETCAMNLPWEECTCKCSEAAFAGQKSWEILEDAGVIQDGFFYDKDAVLIEKLVDDEGNPYEAIPGYTKQETEDIYDEMLQVLCMPMRHGSHYGATSTNDPTFWVIHPTFDRLWHLRRLESQDGFDERWIPDHTCVGHNPEDVTPFHELFMNEFGRPRLEDAGEDRSSAVDPPKNYYKNSELYEMLNPSEMESPYAYDNFDWYHCDAQGVFIHGVA